MSKERAAKFVEEHLKTIFAYALSRVSRKEDAEDLTNDIIVAILQNADRLKNPDAFYGYVWGIAANTYRNFLKKRSRIICEEPDDNLTDHYDFTKELEEQETISVLRREVALLSREYRECAIAYYYEELSCTEIARKYHLSLEMVKYYLFKTRKILKEGICMEREFGEKSFRPAPFTFHTIFTGSFNQEYRDLFARKLPGQILLSAYYTPMTIRELAIELGVSSVYLEDEIALLEKHHLLTKTASGRYQTDLVIFTDDFFKEFRRRSADFTATALTEIFRCTREKLHAVRGLNRYCAQLSDSRILWGLVWFLMLKGNELLEQKYPALLEKPEIYSGTVGTNYGVSAYEDEEAYHCTSFAGYSRIDDHYYAAAADFSIMPTGNRYFCQDKSAFGSKLYRILADGCPSEFLILSEQEERTLTTLLTAETELMSQLYEQLFSCACGIMAAHAPKSVESQIRSILFQTLIFQTTGMIGFYLIDRGVLPLPDFDGPAALYVRENTTAAKASVLTNKELR